jgi:adenosine deaminase
VNKIKNTLQFFLFFLLIHSMRFFDLHNHLYGSITAKKLFEIGFNNPNPRWSLFTNLYNKLYREEFKTENFFEDYKNLERFKNLYFFNKPAPFIEFQSKFNLIIALSKFDEEEIRDVAKDIVTEHAKQEVAFAEYRLMYAPNATREVYESKTLAACEGLQLGEEISQNTIQARLVMSLHRDGNYLEQYTWLKHLMTENDLVRKYLVGIDFCYIEEGFPPSEKKSFFGKVLVDNQENPHTALSILYHVGESFADKTPKSAARWVGESALYGTHRLGHAIALGINPESFADKTISEKVSERLDQLEFEIQYYEKIKSFGAITDYAKLIQEKDLLKGKDKDSQISFVINKQYIDELYTLQEFLIYLIREETKSVIECCPTSNLYIGMLPNMKEHPIHRFVDRNLRVTIASDDPGIFDTTLKREYELAANYGLSQKELEKIEKLSHLYTSEKLSGRNL